LLIFETSLARWIRLAMRDDPQLTGCGGHSDRDEYLGSFRPERERRADASSGDRGGCHFRTLEIDARREMGLREVGYGSVLMSLPAPVRRSSTAKIF